MCKVLILEERSELQTEWQNKISAEGHEVVCASTEEEAVELLESDFKIISINAHLIKGRGLLSKLVNMSNVHLVLTGPQGPQKKILSQQLPGGRLEDVDFWGCEENLPDKVSELAART